MVTPNASAMLPRAPRDGVTRKVLELGQCALGEAGTPRQLLQRELSLGADATDALCELDQIHGDGMCNENGSGVGQ